MGSKFEFSPVVVDGFLERPIGVIEDVELDYDLVGRKLTRGKYSSWHSRGHFTWSELSMKYVILHKILIRNLFPSGHKTSVNKPMGVVLYKIGKKRPINFGELVLSMLKEHAEKKPCKKPIVFPSLICGIISKKLNVITSEHVYTTAPKNILFNANFFDENYHVNDLPVAVEGKRKKLPKHFILDFDSIATKLSEMSGKVVLELSKEYYHLSKVIGDSTIRRREIEVLLKKIQGADFKLVDPYAAEPSGAKDDEGNEVMNEHGVAGGSGSEKADEEFEVEKAEDEQPAADKMN